MAHDRSHELSGPASAARSARRLGVAALVAAILVWGANWPVLKTGLEHITPLWLTALRFVCGAACLLALQAARGEVHRPRRVDWPFIASVALCQMTLNTALVTVALSLLPAGHTAMLTYTTPLWVVPASVLVFRERVVLRQVAGVALGLAGIAVLMNPAAIDWSDAHVLGADAMLLASSLCWAVTILHLRYFPSPSTAYQLAPWQMLLAVPPLALGAFVMEGPFTGDGSLTLWLAAIYVGALATAFCFGAINAASTWLAPATLSTAMLGVPVTGVVLSVVVLGEPLTASLAVGSLAVIGGIVINALPVGSRRR
jgi:drug/metabolite transporter (DMT)-like permease